MEFKIVLAFKVEVKTVAQTCALVLQVIQSSDDSQETTYGKRTTASFGWKWLSFYFFKILTPRTYFY